MLEAIACKEELRLGKSFGQSRGFMLNRYEVACSCNTSAKSIVHKGDAGLEAGILSFAPLPVATKPSYSDRNFS